MHNQRYSTRYNRTITRALEWSGMECLPRGTDTSKSKRAPATGLGSLHAFVRGGES